MLRDEDVIYVDVPKRMSWGEFQRWRVKFAFAGKRRGTTAKPPAIERKAQVLETKKVAGLF